MTTTLSSADRRRSGRPARQAARHITHALVALVSLVACSDNGLVEPSRAPRPFGSPFGLAGHATVIVTPNYSAYDTRSEFNAAGGIDQLNGFDEFTGQMVYDDLPEPWTTMGVTYTSVHNIVLDPTIGMGVSSTSISTDFGAPLRGQFAAASAFTMFGADVTILGPKVPVGLVVSTNTGDYTFTNIDVPASTTGRRFVGITLSQPGAYLTGFRFTIGGAGSALLLDNVAVGRRAVVVQNARPVASVGGSYSGPEGSSIALSLSATDADGDALTYSWDLGDGTTGAGTTPPTSHIYGDNGSYAIMLAVADGHGGVDTARTTANISNVAPTLSAFSLPSTLLALAPAGVTLPISSPFTDPGSRDTHTAALDCGGVTVQASTPNGVAVGSCTFMAAGVYTVRLTVTDDDGGSDTKVATGEVVVYDPTGRVTGGGWVTSPQGGFAVGSPSGGKLTFSLQARYESSATPTGHADFKLTGARQDFRSTTLDWLVVTEGRAQLRGRGTLNGGGDYAFELIATHGSSGDAIRIRAWDRTTGGTVYDSQPGMTVSATTPLGGGNIEPHTN